MPQAILLILSMIPVGVAYREVKKQREERHQKKTTEVEFDNPAHDTKNKKNKKGNKTDKKPSKKDTKVEVEFDHPVDTTSTKKAKKPRAQQEGGKGEEATARV